MGRMISDCPDSQMVLPMVVARTLDAGSRMTGHSSTCGAHEENYCQRNQVVLPMLVTCFPACSAGWQ